MSLLHAQKLVLFRGGDSMIEHQVFVRGVELSLDEHCDPASLLQAVDSMQLCSGAARSVEFPLARSSNMTTWNESLYHTKCKGVVSGPEKFCIASKYLRRLLLNQRCRARQLKRKENYARKLKARTQATVRRLRAKAKSLDEALTQQKQANHAIKESALKKKIDKLPPKQKAAIMQCFEAASRKSLKGVRYNPEWLLECILMHMKRPRLYEPVRREKILVLPSRTCLRKYMRQHESTFGFNAAVLSGIAKKTQNMSELERHGGIIIDEMKLAENFAVAGGTGKIDGFVDLGPFTPEADKSVTCDDGLVIMFQPLSAPWHQILGVFASRGNVKAPLLSKMVLEAVLLAENAGLRVDYITCDGATWNRAVWRKFGISATAKVIRPSAPHPCGDDRRLFLSDFPHLVKCVRNGFIGGGYKTPEGHVDVKPIKIAHEHDKCAITLKVMPKITTVHISPNNFEKIKVNLAFHLFSLDALRGLYFYKANRKIL
ncbi:hypothetical protein HPB49_009713 [Dermacentor silvarum]|uniref:Uncharacterized protein n=1 Tax=Dermacentor silvarum TaxID=543639 RepID=A0ACB8DYV5_DERSI|nr:hypothetical protein HPB49_009713 [Dermacentor silvarum]